MPACRPGDPRGGHLAVTAPLPPPLHSLLAGTRLAAGLGQASVLPDLDFETFSLAGYVWDRERNRWEGPPGAPKNTKGLPVVGAANYAAHESAEVLLLAYDLKDGRGRRRWRPGMPPPADLFAHIASGGLLEAWNVAFERWVWELVCVPRMRWPAVHPAQWRCAAAKARAHALPGNLAAAGTALALATQKDPRGAALMRKFSMPRNPTKGDPRWRVPMVFDDAAERAAAMAAGDPRAERQWLKVLTDDAADSHAYADYNETDIAAEAEASARIPDLDADELAWWQVHEAINHRGVAVDVQGLEDAAAIVDAAQLRYNAELSTLTGVDSASKVQQLLGWLHSAGVHLDSLDEEAVADALQRPEIQGPARRVLEIRSAIGSASVKKVFAMRNAATPAGRLHDLYVYHGARTGRSTGDGPQPTNLPKAGPNLRGCGIRVKGKLLPGSGCGKHYAPAHGACPHCGRPAPPLPPDGAATIEWHPGIAEEAIEALRTRSLDWVEYAYGDALHVVAGCLRGMYVAKPGFDLISTDYNSIEAIGLAMLAGEQWRIDVFRTHGKIYEASAAAAFGVPFEEFAAHRERTGQHHPLRQKGKVLELACLAPETLVLTDRGYVQLVDVRASDRLWDGIEWVNHRGVVPRGRRETISLGGARMTPDHLMRCGLSWRAASQLVSNESTRSLALATGSANLPSWATKPAGVTRRFGFAARVVRSLTSFCSRTCARAEPRAATDARRCKQGEPSRRFSSTPTWFPTTGIAAACLTGSLRQSDGATGRPILRSPTTEGAASPLPPSGERTNARSCATSSPLTGGTTRAWKWIASTLMAAMSLGTFGSSRKRQTSETGAASKPCSSESPIWSDVYDIANAGPRNRFTIRTSEGHLIVHNCGYGGWLGSAHAFGMPGTDDEIKTAILAWRRASPSVEWLWGGQRIGHAASIAEHCGFDNRAPLRGLDRWDSGTFLYGVEGAAVSALLAPGSVARVTRLDGTPAGVSFTQRGDALYCVLPSGRPLTYHRPRLQPGERGGYEMSYEGWNTNPKNGPKGWVRMRTWGSRLVENINQAACSDLLRFACRNLEAAGYPVVLHVYDEIVSEVPEGWGSLEEFESIVTRVPAWAADWPVRAPGGWRGKRYRKG